MAECWAHRKDKSRNEASANFPSRQRCHVTHLLTVTGLGQTVCNLSALHPGVVCQTEKEKGPLLQEEANASQGPWFTLWAQPQVPHSHFTSVSPDSKPHKGLHFWITFHPPASGQSSSKAQVTSLWFCPESSTKHMLSKWP